jgi:hypothetical protein
MVATAGEIATVTLLLPSIPLPPPHPLMTIARRMDPTPDNFHIIDIPWGIVAAYLFSPRLRPFNARWLHHFPARNRGTRTLTRCKPRKSCRPKGRLNEERRIWEPVPADAADLRGERRNLAGSGRSSAYKDFLTLWKDAEPDIPILKEAKAEYAKLQ